MTVPSTIEEPVEVQHRATSQIARVLKLLQQNGHVTNVELIHMRILRGSERVRELREEGHRIVSHRVKGGLWEYVYMGKRDDEEGAA